MLTKKDFNYELPSELIAQEPALPRDHSRLLVFDRQKGRIVSTESFFYQLPQILANYRQKTGQNFLIVRNNSAVIPARLFGSKKETGGQIELLLIKNLGQSSGVETWECLTKPGLKPGQELIFPTASELTAFCRQETGYTRQIEFQFPTSTNFYDLLDQIGTTPLPPYIHSDQQEDQLRQIYQTIYAKNAGSVAAPTAGLHFTTQVENALIEAGFETDEVTLHVGLGTFLTVKEKGDLKNHQMHAETFSISPQVAERLNQARRDQKKILAVGTTTTRVLEASFDQKTGQILPSENNLTQIFLYPPAKFNVIDGLLTNFHLPESTLLMLISAFTSQPNTDTNFRDFANSPIGRAYQTAIEERFRFFSFGDGMLIL